MAFDYPKLLTDPRWQQRRLEIFLRDHWMCRQCGAKDKTLHVHHKRYRRGLMPWEYPADELLTLCVDCHDAAHGKTRIPLVGAAKHAMNIPTPEDYAIADARRAELRRLMEAERGKA